MRILDIKTTYRCNNLCQLCCQNRDLRQSNSDMTFNEAAEIIKKEIVLGVDKIVLTGGEPLLNKDILKIISYAHDMSITTIQLQTNGRLLKDKSFLDDVIKAGVNEFGISLHGHTANIHEKFSNTESYFDVITALENLKDHSCNTVINCVITKSNYEYLVQMANFVKENEYANVLQFAYLHAIGNAERQFDRTISLSEASEKIKNVIHSCMDSSIKILTEAIPFCLMQGLEKHVAELYFDNEVITYDKHRRREYSKNLNQILKTKGEKCKKCIFNSICQGVWAEYPLTFGYSELIPVVDFGR